jgi:DNA-binding PadR family transcriptional regulator
LLKKAHAPSALKPHWFQIMLTLGDRASHGQEIRDEILERTEGEMHLWPGTLYGSLRQLADEGLIVECPAPEGAEHGGGVPRYYALTQPGRERLIDEVRRLEAIIGVASAKGLSGA